MDKKQIIALIAVLLLFLGIRGLSSSSSTATRTPSRATQPSSSVPSTASPSPTQTAPTPQQSDSPSPSEAVPIEASDCQIYIDIDFEENLFFSKYNVEIYVDDKNIGTAEHGKNFTCLLTVKEGTHTVTFYKESDNSINEKKSIEVTEDTTYQFGISSHNSSIDIDRFKTVSGLQTAITMIEVVGLDYAEAKEKLTEAGFSNIEYTTPNNSFIWDDTSWQVVAQSIESGVAVDKSCEITLSCIKIGEDSETGESGGKSGVIGQTEINPDIPLGTVYELGQGMYECESDIPAGRYVIEWIGGNQFGGYIDVEEGGRYIGSSVSIDPDFPFTCVLEPGDKFEITLASMRFTKITSLPNNRYLQEDGSYRLGAGIFFEGVDIPEGKYNVTAVGGNPFGIYVSTKNKSFLSLDQGETYHNMILDHPGAQIEVTLGIAKFEPVG